MLLPKAVLLQDILKELCCFNVRKGPWVVQPQPLVTHACFAKALNLAAQHGRSPFSYKYELPLFQSRAQFACPGNLWVALALAAPVFGALSDDRTWMITPEFKVSDRSSLLPPWSEDSGMIVLFFGEEGRVTSVFHQDCVKIPRSLGKSRSKFMPPFINWKDPAVPSALKPIPELNVTNVVRNKRHWEEQISDLGPVGRIVVSCRKMTYQMKTGYLQKVDRRNLPTCDYAEE
eukprot:2741637-Rhodomonas_salina.1